MARNPIRSSFWLWIVTLGVLVQPIHAQAPAGSVGVKTYTGYYNDTAVYFAAFETNDFAFALANNIVYAPRLAQINESALPQMIFFLNGTGLQTVVLQTEPGQADYNPLWQVVSAQWVSSDPMPLITSLASAQHWVQQGKLAVQSTGIIFNGPVFLVNRSLNLTDTGSLAPTISPDEFQGINPSIRTAYFTAHQGYYNGQLVTFLALEHAPGQISHAPGAIPVPTLSLNTLGANAFARFYAVAGEPPVIDSVPIPIQQVIAASGAGTPAYGGAASASQPSNAAVYGPIWSVFSVTFNPGVTPQPLRSVQEIQQAADAGMVIVAPGRSDDTFNCPVPFYYTTGGAAPSPIYMPPGSPGTNPTTTPGYIPPATPNPSPTGNAGSSPSTTGGTSGASSGNPY